jgi:CRISPR-associated protein Csm2
MIYQPPNRQYSGQGGQLQRGGQPQPPKQLPSVDTWFNEDKYVERAEQVISKLQKNSRGVFILTTSKIRNLLSLSATLHDEVQNLPGADTLLSDEIKGRLNYLRIQFVYQAGRESGVKDFVEKAQLLDVLKKVQDKATVLRFCAYMESLVAYFKYNGGRDQ